MQVLNFYIEENDWSQVHVVAGNVVRTVKDTLTLLKVLKVMLFSIEEMLVVWVTTSVI